MKFKRIKGVILMLLLIVASTTIVCADGSKSWWMEHKYADMYFSGNVNFLEGAFLRRSSIIYFASIAGVDKELSMLSTTPNYNYYRADNDEVGTLMISTKNYHNGNCVKVYVAHNHRINRTQYKDWLKKINVDLQYGTITNYVAQSFTID